MQQIPVQVQTRAYEAHSVMPPHEHDGYYLCHVDRGSLLDTTRLGTRRISATTSFLRRPGERHSNRFGSGGTQCTLVHFDADWLHACGVDLGAVTDDRAPTSAEVNRLATLCKENIASPVGPILLQAGALELLGGMLSAPISGVDAGRDAYRELVSAATQGTEVLRDAARWLERTGLSRRALDKVLRCRQGLSFSGFVRRERLRHALRRIRDSTDSLAWIAHESGFADQAHMTREIKRFVGATPGRMRRLQSRRNIQD